MGQWGWGTNDQSFFSWGSWSLWALLITCSPVRRSRKIPWCLSLCEKFGAGPYWARSFWLLLELCQWRLGLLFQCSCSPSTTMFSPLVSDIFASVNNHLPFFFSRTWSPVFSLFFSLHQILWESQVAFSPFPKGVYYTNLLPREAENNYISALLITTLETERKTNTLRAVPTTLNYVWKAQVHFVYLKKIKYTTMPPIGFSYSEPEILEAFKLCLITFYFLVR